MDFKKILHILFPPSTDVLLVENAQTLPVSPTAVAGITVLLPFRDPLVRACIHEAKFHYNKKAIALLGEVLKEHLDTYQSTSVLIPMPLSSARKRERGYNQVAEVVKRAAPNMHVYEKVLKRTKNTKPQTSLAKDERAKNVVGAFGVRQKYIKDIKNAHIILIDDVLTTGATMNAAKSELLQHGPASVTCVALAH